MTSNISGIYMILNEKSNKVYIGQSVNINLRFIRHSSKLSCNKHENSHLQSAFNKYGKESFKFEILEIYEQNSILLTQAEQYWIDYFKFIGIELYNIAPVAGSLLGYKHSKEACLHKSLSQLGRKRKPHTEETKLKISISKKAQKLKLTELHKKQISPLGRRFSEETKQKMSAARKNMPFSEEHKNNLRRAWEKRKQKNA